MINTRLNQSTRTTMGLLQVVILMMMLVLQTQLPLVSAQDPSSSSCATEDVEFCLDQAQRSCALDDNGKPQCTGCAPGSIELRSQCVPTDKIELFLYQEAFQVDYRTVVPREDRWLLLKSTIEFITNFQQNNPDAPFALGLTPASADNDDDLKHRTGLLPNLFAKEENATADAFEPFDINATIAVPSSVDWVSSGAVTSVKDQGRCGCCWAVSVIGAIEGAVAVSSSYLQSLSWQQLVSCDPNNLGCDGGTIVFGTAYATGFDGLNTAGGVATLADYPYTDFLGSTTTQCRANNRNVAVSVSSGKIIMPYDSQASLEKRIAAIKQQLAIQPISVVMKSNCPIFANYRSGILTEDGECACTDNLCADHAVLLVGYNDDTPIPYWIIKNSWSTNWGDEGYAYIAQDPTRGQYGLFGLMLHGVAPNVSVNVTVQVEETSPEEEGLLWWHILLISIGGVFVFCCIFWTCANLIAPNGKEESE